MQQAGSKVKKASPNSAEGPNLDTSRWLSRNPDLPNFFLAEDLVVGLNLLIFVNRGHVTCRRSTDFAGLTTNRTTKII